MKCNICGAECGEPFIAPIGQTTMTCSLCVPIFLRLPQHIIDHVRSAFTRAEVLDAQAEGVCIQNEALRARVKELETDRDRLMTKVCDIYKLVHDRFHEIGQFRDPNFQHLGD